MDILSIEHKIICTLAYSNDTFKNKFRSIFQKESDRKESSVEKDR